MNPRPIKVQAQENYELLVFFQNGEQRVFDMKPLLHLPLYQPLKNKALFASAQADGMCVFWNDELDLCPDMVYSNSRPYQEEQKLFQ